MARTRTRRGRGDGGPSGLDLALRVLWIAAALLAFVPGVIVVPAQFVDAHHAAVAREIESSGAEPYPVLEVRQKVDYSRRIWAVDMQVATYRTGSGTSTVRLHGYDGSAYVVKEEGWHVAAGRDDRLEVYVTEDGRNGFLREDYRPALNGEYDDLYRVAVAWVAGWALVGLAALTASSVRRARRGATGPRRAALAPALYCAGAATLVAVAYAVSFPLAGLN